MKFCVAVLIVLWFYFSLKMVEADSFETVVSIRQTTAHNFPEVRNIGTHVRENTDHTFSWLVERLITSQRRLWPMELINKT
jgi:hypothetical protein